MKKMITSFFYAIIAILVIADSAAAGRRLVVFESFTNTS
jgi:hypothetical protein